MAKAAVISAILENPHESQQEFNTIASNFQDIIRGRMGIPLGEGRPSLVSFTVVGSMDRINSLTGKLGEIHDVSVKTAVSRIELED